MVVKTTGTAETASTSIIGHRHFPVIAALWFAALFGLGSIAIRPALIENAVLTMRLDTLVAAAAPPLGMTARLLLALVMGGIGACVGMALARRIAAPRGSGSGMRLRARDAHPDAPARRPLSAMTDLYDEDEAAPDPVSGPPAAARGQRRRSLAISEDDYPAEMVDRAPLPGSNPEFGAAAIDAFEPAEPTLEPLEPLELSDLAPSASDAQPEVAAEAAVSESWSIPDRAEPATSAAAIAAFPLDSLSLAELSTRLASAMAGRRSRLAAGTAMALGQLMKPSPSSPATPQWTSAAVMAPAPNAAEEPVAAHRDADREPAASGEIVPPSPRFSGALPAALRPVISHHDEDDDEPGFIDSRFALPARGLARLPAAEAAALEPAAPDPLSDDVVAAAPGEAPEFGATEPAEPFVAELAEPDFEVGEAEDTDTEPLEDTGYSSLLDISVSALSRPGHSRIDDLPQAETDAIEPVVVFPGQLARFAASPAEATGSEPASSPASAPASSPATGLRRFDPPGSAPRGSGADAAGQSQPGTDPEATERALRAALSTLQRMSGAA